MATWTANYEGNEIRIERPWLIGTVKLFVNNKLQDEDVQSLGSALLLGHLVSKDGEKKSIKVRFTSVCRLFIDDENIEVVKTS